MEMKGLTFVFFGIVGSGKGTQVKLLQDYLRAKGAPEDVYAYPGNEYRRLIESGEYTGSLIKDSMARGELQPDFLTNSVFTSILVSGLTEEKTLIVDGYPRTLVQAKTFQDAMKFYKRDNVKIIYIEVGKDEAMKRNLLRGRNDDTEAGIARRFDEHINNVVPSMNYFKDKPGYEVYAINGEQEVAMVHADIIKALNL